MHAHECVYAETGIDVWREREAVRGLFKIVPTEGNKAATGC